MVIPLNDNLRIFGGQLAWELQHRKVVKGKDRWESFKWFTRLGQAMREAGEIEFRLSEGNSLDEAIEAASRVSHRYERLLDAAFSEVAQKARSITG